MIDCNNKNFIRKPLDYIHNQQLTSSFEPVTIPEDLDFDTYLAKTKGGGDLEVKWVNTSSESFTFSLDDGTLPLNTGFEKRSYDKNNVLFYAKGDDMLQIMFVKE